MNLTKLPHFVLEKSVVLDVIFYQSTKDLSLADTTSASPLVICPSPLVADGLRRLMPANLEIITISKWVSDYLKIKNITRSNKAELMLRLSSVWRHYFPNEKAHQFFKAFEIFTDLRSFSLNLELLSEFLKEMDEVTTKSILLFWTFLENEKIIDEHKSYQVLSEIEINRPLWVIGFKHLSGIQIDMLKVLAEKTEVSIFFPKDVYVETLSTDWIRWIVPEEKIEIEAPGKSLKLIYFPKGKLNTVLNSLEKNTSQFDVALASTQSSFNFKQEVATQDKFFKSPEDLFSIAREKLFEELSEELKEKSLEIEVFSNNIEEKKKEALKAEDFILYKTLLLLSDALTYYGEFQTTVDGFTLNVLKMILELNSPRVSLALLTPKPNTRLFELNELPYNDSEHPLVMIASSNYGPLKAGESKYSEKMIDALKVIGPIKRAGLDFSNLKSELVQTLACQKNVLLMEEGLELVDLAWREILKGFELEIVDPEAKYLLREKKDYLLTSIKSGPYKISKFSPSRLQNYIDCPRKYYFSSIEKIDHRPEDRLKIAPDEMGTIEHKIIEKYFADKKIDANLMFNSKEHEELCHLLLNNFLSEHKVVLSEKNKLATFYELLHFTQNGIEYLIDFSNKHSAISVEFECSLGNNPWNLVGSIDCLIQLPENQVALFDFKRSAAAIGSKKETLAFDKIQIWAYLLTTIRHRHKKIHSWGYLNLSEIESSQTYDETETPVLNDKVLDEFQQLLLKTIEEANSEVHFKDNPRNTKICDFCEVQLFCSKGSCA